MRQPGDTSDSHDQLHISGAHSACDIEHKKYQAANHSRGEGGEELPPSTKREMHCQSNQESGYGNKIGDPSTLYVEDGTHQGTGGCGRRIRQV